jgi:hypothetical protein
METLAKKNVLTLLGTLMIVFGGISPPHTFVNFLWIIGGGSLIYLEIQIVMDRRPSWFTAMVLIFLDTKILEIRTMLSKLS